jgi:hypothetical protein
LQFTDQLGKVAQTPNKLRDVSVVCILDLCRGAARARPDPGKDLPIHANVSDYIHEVLVSSQNRSPLRSQLIVLQSILTHWDNERPFWESPDEIDVTIFADALVALYRFTPLDDVLPLFQTCLEAERSDAVKLVAIKASVTLSVEVRNICLSEALWPIKGLLGARDIMATYNSASFRASGRKIPNHLQGNHTPFICPRLENHTFLVWWRPT